MNGPFCPLISLFGRISEVCEGKPNQHQGPSSHANFHKQFCVKMQWKKLQQSLTEGGIKYT